MVTHPRIVMGKYTIWDVDGATPMVDHGPLLSHLLIGSCAIYFHHGVIALTNCMTSKIDHEISIIKPARNERRNFS